MTALIVALAIAILVASSATCASLYRGMGIAQNRLGADIIILPADVGVSASQTLFTAEPANIYLPENATEIVASVDGVAQVSPQFFTQSLNQSCCSVVGATRVVGIDMESDFVLHSWYEEGEFPTLGSDGMLLGYSLTQIEGGQASILGNVFYTRGYLAETGTGVDKTIFVDIDTARRIGAESPYLTGVWETTDPYTSISCVMVKVSDGTDADNVARAIEEAYPFASATAASGVIGDAAEQIALFLKVIVGLVCAVLAITVIALFGRFSSLLQWRRKEMGLLRALGAAKSQTFLSLLIEVLIISLTGGVFGSAAGIFVGFNLTGSLHDVMGLPGGALMPSTTVVVFFAGLIIAALIGCIAIACVALRSSYLEPHEIIRKGEL